MVDRVEAAAFNQRNGEELPFRVNLVGGFGRGLGVDGRLMDAISFAGPGTVVLRQGPLGKIERRDERSLQTSSVDVAAGRQQSAYKGCPGRPGFAVSRQSGRY